MRYETDDGTPPSASRVDDTGIGIPRERQADIFESFTQVDARIAASTAAPGSASRSAAQLTELLDGEIAVESEEGQGSTFWLDLVLEKQRGARTVRRLPDSLQGLRVLVLERSASGRAMLKEQLAGWGCRVETCGDAAEAIRCLTTADGTDPVRLMLVDAREAWSMGDALRGDAALARIPLILLAFATRPSVDATRDARVAAVLHKPVRRGALFEAVLEAVGAVARVAEAKPARPHVDAPPALHVLVAEDNAINQRVAVRMLERAGCHADTVTNGMDALAAVAHTDYDLVLMDVQMPEMDGLEAAAEIRRFEVGTSRRIPIVALTAHAFAEDRARCIAAGMDDYIEKPIVAGRLVAVLERWGRPRLAQRVAPRVLDEFLSSAAAVLSRIGASLSSGDRDALARESQGLKSGCLAVGASAIHAACEEIESLGARGELTGAREALTRAHEELDRLRSKVAGRAPDAGARV